MNEWMSNEKWRKKVNNIYIMRNHNFAFSAWEIERIKDGVPKYVTLVHVDSHLDDGSESVNIPGILEEISSPKEAILIAEEFDYSNDNIPNRPYMRIDNFIWPAIMRNTIGDVIYISDDSLDELNEESLKNIVNNSSQKCFRYDEDEVLFERLLMHLIESKKGIVRYQSLEEHEYEKEQFLKSVNDKYTILDLDLDYFNNSNKYNSDSKLESKDQIVRNLMYLKNLTDWDVYYSCTFTRIL